MPLKMQTSAALDSTPVDLVSCLCVTRGRVGLLARAVACFRAQTWGARELVVLCESDDLDTRHYLDKALTAWGSSPADSGRHGALRIVEVPASPKQPLGTLRNLAVQASLGRYVAQWDDDDWSAPTRLAEQMAALHASGKRACVLERWTMFDALTQSAWLSERRTWEGSLLCRRDALPAYAPLARGEDTPVLQQLLAADDVVTVDEPSLYAYVVHDHNTWGRSHWEQVLRPHATPLGAAQSALWRQRLAEPGFLL